MAARKKSSTAITALNSEVGNSTLAKAGVEVKLTKGEIAEYIAAKAQKQIAEEIKAIEAKYGDRHSLSNGTVKVPNPPKRIANVVKAINAADEHVSGTTKASVVYAGKDYGWRGLGNSWLIRVGGIDILSYRLIDDEEVPPEYAVLQDDKVRWEGLHAKLRELQQKNYKVLLVESILSGSVAGTTVLADLDKMVQQMVAAPVAQS